MVGYALYIISDKKFSKYHVMILMIANYLGPDLGWALGIGDFTHTYVGYLAFAVFIAFFYSYFTRFTPDFKKRVLVDKGYNRIPYPSAYFLACAGGIMHVYLDGVMNHQGKFHLFPALGSLDEFIVSIHDFFTLWYEAPGPVNSAVAVASGMGLVLAFIPFFWYLLKSMDKLFVVKVISFVATFMVLFYFFGGLTTYHSDAGAILYVALFWIAPFGLCAAAMKCPPPRLPVEWRTKMKQNFVPALLSIDLIFGIAFIAVGSALLALGDVLVPALAGLTIESTQPLAAHAGSLRVLDIFLGVSFLLMGCVNILFFARFKRHKEASVNIIVASGLSLVMGFISSVLAGVLFTSGAAIADIVIMLVSGVEDVVSPSELLIVAYVAGAAFAGLAALSFAIGAGIMLERKRMIRFAFLVNAALAWTVFGLYVCCLLSQDGVERRFA
jgi:hypothetical protein